MFNNEERIVLNGICNNEKLDFSKNPFWILCFFGTGCC